MAEENQLKGQAFKGFAGAVESLFGEPGRARWTEALPDELRATWTHGGLVTGGWYPMAWYRSFHAAAQEAFRGERELARRISHEATRRDLEGVYRFVLRFVSPHTLLGQASRIFALYNRGGRVLVRDNEAARATLEYRDCHGCDANVWEDLVGGNIAALETTRVRVTKATVLEGGGSAAFMVLQLRWE